MVVSTSKVKANKVVTKSLNIQDVMAISDQFDPKRMNEDDQFNPDEQVSDDEVVAEAVVEDTEVVAMEVE